MSFKLSNEAKTEKFIDERENDKDVREIDIHLAGVLRLVDTSDFAPGNTLHSGFITRLNLCGGRRRERSTYRPTERF